MLEVHAILHRQRCYENMTEKTGTLSDAYGKSIYGLLIDFACQRYGWTMDYVLWGISYVNLNMLFADAITTVYLSDEERKKLGRGDGRMVDADDPKNRDLIRKMISE